MNVVKLCGGLGNQMFQYAFGKSLAKLGNRTLYNTRFYKKPQDPVREFNLPKFNVDINISHSLNPRNIRERKYRMLVNTDNCNFHGYWQDTRWFASVLDELKKEFTVKTEYYTPEYLKFKDQILNSESVALHVRHGDYVSKNSCYVLPFGYYAKALAEVKGDLFIFSDDIPWCQRQFTPEYFNRKITFIHLVDYLDFELMRLCKHKIIANSTFSLWAALLDGEGTVIVPKLWRYKLGETTPSGIDFKFPNNWIKC